METKIPANIDEYKARMHYYNKQIADLEVEQGKMMIAYAVSQGAYPIGTKVKTKKGFEYTISNMDVDSTTGKVLCYWDNKGRNNYIIYPDSIISAELPK